jgi:hypothetical protein
MAITDIQISEELKTNAPSIKYSGNEGPKSPQEMQQKAEYDMQEYIIEFENVFPEMKELRGTEEYMEMLEDYFRGLAKGPVLPSDEDPINPFGPKPEGPVLPDRMMAGTDTPGIEIEMLQELLEAFREKFNRDPVSIDELKKATEQMREKAAYGGIMGVDGRKQYGIGSWFQENVMDPLKVKVLGLPDEYDEDGNLKRAKDYDAIKAASQARVDSQPEGYEGFFDTLFKGEKNEKGVREGGITSTVAKNIIPIIGGAAAGLFTKNTESDTPGLPSDTTALALDDLKKSANILDQKQGMAAGLNFLPTVASRKYSPSEMLEVYQNAANGGRIGFAGGGGFGPEGWSGIERAKRVWNSMSDDIQNKYNGFNDFFMGGEWIDINMANGGRINRAEGGLNGPWWYGKRL